MRILALETSSREASVATLHDGQIIGEIKLAADKRTAQWLAPAIDGQLQHAGWDASHVELIAVTQGPGSFTGLRIGITTAKTFAYAAGANILGVNTLEVIARQSLDHTTQNELWTVIDAQRQQLFAALFLRQSENRVLVAQGTAVVDADQWLAQVRAGQAVSGPGLQRVWDRLPSDVEVVEAFHWAPRAATVGRIAHEQYRAGQRHDLWKLVPQYFRPSAAEENLHI